MSGQVKVPKNMVRDSQMRLGVVILFAGLLLFAGWRTVKALTFSPSADDVMPVTPLDPISVVTEVVTVTEQVIVPIVETVTVTVPGPAERVYIEGPERVVARTVEVERVVPVLPAAPVVGLAAVCVLAEGLTGIYLDGVGIVGNTCTVVPVPSLSQRFTLEITR